jgi:hypothetical protein
MSSRLFSGRAETNSNRKMWVLRDMDVDESRGSAVMR